MNKDLVSIIMPTYNCSKFISLAIESVLRQTYKNWELIIVDDCSTDDTEDVVKKYLSDGRINYYKLEENSGAAVARNLAMKKSNGRYIAFLDSDDMWKFNKLEKQLQFMTDNAYSFTCTTYEKIDENGNKLNKLMKPKEKADYNRVLLDCPVGNSTVIYDVLKLGNIETPNIRKRNDVALWLKILKKEKYIYGLEEVLTEYRVRKNSISSNKFNLIKYHWQLYRDIEHLSIIRSAFHICWWGVIKLLKLK